MTATGRLATILVPIREGRLCQGGHSEVERLTTRAGDLTMWSRTTQKGH
jgi:hypothetical protein